MGLQPTAIRVMQMSETAISRDLNASLQEERWSTSSRCQLGPQRNREVRHLRRDGCHRPQSQSGETLSKRRAPDPAWSGLLGGRCPGFTGRAEGGVLAEATGQSPACRIGAAPSGLSVATGAIFFIHEKTMREGPPIREPDGERPLQKTCSKYFDAMWAYRDD